MIFHSYVSLPEGKHHGYEYEHSHQYLTINIWYRWSFLLRVIVINIKMTI